MKHGQVDAVIRAAEAWVAFTPKGGCPLKRVVSWGPAWASW